MLKTTKINFDKNNQEDTKIKGVCLLFEENSEKPVESVIYKGTNDKELLLALKEL